MKYLFLLILFVGVVSPITLSAARFDWVLGQPVVVDDLDNETHGTRYDWVLGQPTVVREEGEAAPEPPAEPPTSDIEIKGSGIIEIKGDGILEIK